jgi:sugar phosphate isomerase/epimerase
VDIPSPARDDIPRWRRALEATGVRVAAIGSATKLNASTQADVPEIQATLLNDIAAAQALDCPYVITYFGGNLAYDGKAAMQRYKRNIRPVLEAAERAGVVVLIETEYNRIETDVTRTAEGCLELVEFIDSPYFKINFDPCNLHIAGEEAFPYAYELLRDLSPHMHLKDAVKFNPYTHGLKYRKVLQTDARGSWVCVALGTGAMNYEAFLKRLQEDRFQGVATIELHTLPELIEATFAQSVAYLRSKGLVAEPSVAEAR